MNYCKDCGREIARRIEKAIAEPRNEAHQQVWATSDDNWVCEATNEEHRPGGKQLFIFTTVEPFIEAGLGEGYHFTYDDRSLYYEEFSAGSHSGAELSDLDGPLNEDEVFGPHATAFEEALENFKEIWSEHWMTTAQPAIQQADKEAVEAWARRSE